MNKSFNYIAITSCFVLSTTLAHANPDSSQGNMHDQMFKTMDSNSDGMVTRDEFNNFGAKKFQELDANSDGQITGEEINATHKKMGNGSVRNKMDDSGKDPKGKERSQWDNANSRNQSTTGGRSNNSWTPQDSSGNRSDKDSWDKKRDDAGHKSNDDNNN